MRPSATALLVMLSLGVVVASAGVARAGGASHGVVATGTRVMLSVAADGTVRIDGVVVRGDAAILGALKAAVAAGKTEITIACDKSRPYGEVIHVMDLCKQAGLTKIAFAVAP